MATASMKFAKTILFDAPTGVGKRIKNAREGKKVTELAYHAGISPAYWYKIEAEEPETVSIEIIRKIEQLLGIDLGASIND